MTGRYPRDESTPCFCPPCKLYVLHEGSPRSGARRPPGLRQFPDIQIFMVGEQVTVRVWRAAPRVWPPDRHRGDDAITMPLRGLREMVVHSFYTLTILRGYEFAPPFLNNRSDPDDYVVVQACCQPVSCCLFHSVVHSSSVDF